MHIKNQFKKYSEMENRKYIAQKNQEGLSEVVHMKKLSII